MPLVLQKSGTRQIAECLCGVEPFGWLLFINGEEIGARMYGKCVRCELVQCMRRRLENGPRWGYENVGKESGKREGEKVYQIKLTLGRKVVQW